MGIFAGVGLLLGGAITAAVSAIAAVVATVITAASIILSAIVATVTATIVGIASTVSSILAGVASMLPINLVSLETKFLWAEALATKDLFMMVQVIGMGFSEFLTAIHFATMLKVHNIAFLVSDKYRAMMRNVWGELARFAEAVELPAGYLEAAINTARVVVLDVSGFMGRPYDLGEITWLNDFQILLKRIESKAQNYRRNPQIIWDDLNELIVKPAIDNKARAQQEVFTTIENIITYGEETIQNLENLRYKLRDDLNKLPFQWAEDIVQKTDLVWSKFESWRNELYLPVIGRITEVIDALHVKQTENKNNLNQLFRDMSNPGDYLQTIDRLPVMQRTIQEDKIREVSTRSVERAADNWQEKVDAETITMDKILQALEFIPTPSALPYKETPGLVAPIGGQIKNQKSWFVGEY
jgi:hypothetical protein